MKVAAVIAEYNPFHNGHKYHIEETRKKGHSHIIAIMSGNFVQRGSMAIVDKFTRAKYAILGGADLVIELPLPWSMSSAHDFAYGGVEIAKAVGCVNSLSFGCETDDELSFYQTVEIISRSQIQDDIKENVRNGLSYPRAITQALEDNNHCHAAELLNTANNMLAFEYVCSLTDSAIVPCFIKRVGCEHDSREMSCSFASASAIRNVIYNTNLCDVNNCTWKEFVPKEISDLLSLAICNKTAPVDLKRADVAVLSRLRNLTANDFKSVPFVCNGLENRLFSAVQSAITFEQACDLAKNKQITHARIRRTLLMSALQPPTETIKNVPYLRILAMNHRGTELLRQMKTNATLPIIQKHADYKILDDYARMVYDFNMRASDLYSLCLPNPTPCATDATQSPFVLSDN